MEPSRSPAERAVDKWREAALGGFQVIPDILLKKQVELDLTATDMLVLINVTMHWWYHDQRPFPRTSTIAKRMGVGPRTVQRSIQKLVDSGLVSRIEEEKDGETRQVIDLQGLVDQLANHVKEDADYIARQQRRREP